VGVAGYEAGGNERSSCCELQAEATAPPEAGLWEWDDHRSFKQQVSTQTRIGALKWHHGTVPIGKLRVLFGSQYAKGCSDIETLREALHKLDESALTKLMGANRELASID
jgi:hypothetical protein